MKKIALRSVAAHKIRFLLTILSVVLGTAFVAGSFMFTNSLSKTFEDLFSSVYSDVDAVVSAKPGQPAPPLELLGELEAQGGVAAVNNADEQQVVFATGQGDPLRTGGAPAVITPYYAGDDVAGPPTPIAEGREPRGADEMVLNATAAQEHGVQVGDHLIAVDPEGRREFTVTGLYSFDAEVGGYIGGAVAPEVFAEEYSGGVLPRGAWVKAAEGTDRQQLVGQLQKEYPQLEVRTGQAVADEATEAVKTGLSFLNYFLVAFGLVALLVGTFIIANTFSMIVAQRTREFALLRSLGASARQLTTSVVLEALLVGVIGSALGVVAGYGLVHAIYAAMSAFGLGLPNSGVGLTPEAVAVPLVLGLLVTVGSAWAPARRAGRVHPVEAMRSGDQSSSSSLRGRTIAGAVVAAVGAVAAGAAVFLGDATTGTRASILGVGAVLLIGGVFLISPALSRPVVPVLGRVIGAPFGAVGRLAATNSGRNPRRTATTAFALTLGLALVVSLGMLGATMKNSVKDSVESNITSDLVVTGPQDGGFFPVPAGAVNAVASVDGVADAPAIGLSPVLIDGMGSGGGAGAAYGEGNVTGALGVTVSEGEADLSTPGVLVDQPTADAKGWAVGDAVPATVMGTDTEVPLTLLGIYEPNVVLGPVLLSGASVDEFAGITGGGNSHMVDGLVMVFVNGDGSVSTQELQDRVKDATEKFIVADVLTPTEFAGQQAVMIDQMLNILYALLALAIIVAVLGIINTLALNVIERRQEVGMLRAVGTHRRQVRTMITLEAIQIALYGAVVGALLGLGLGWAFVTVLGDDGLQGVVVPWGLVGVTLLGSALVGALAAVWPAMKAAKTPPLEAIAD
ncbi:MAG TPA: ABC transporter permease [Candidatus Corynebacterium gallistercoris]|uniref:ABC transporter permease n=1 Tax=Candidatus Corynebacterium gallistercoris TaxID=2838530 RepID=A0A9D1S136_9CORY|nr:ABC transporter permease [Candidatus Corynebacterium gallistercoris]